MNFYFLKYAPTIDICLKTLEELSEKHQNIAIIEKYGAKPQFFIVIDNNTALKLE
jgi:hypothetical protein